MNFDIYGMGNALLDILVEVPDKFITQLNLTKGRQHVINEKQSKALLDKIKFANATIAAGGSASNAVATCAQLGLQAGFCGKIGDDEYGIQYENETKEAGVYTRLHKTNKLTGHVVVLITPDAERTMAVNLGCSTDLKKEEVIEQDIASSKILHIDGYQIEQAAETCQHALKLAKKHKIKISIDASDAGVVQRNKSHFEQLIKKYATILFANEEEAAALTGKKAEEAVSELGRWCETAVVKCGKNGSLISHNGVITMIECTPAKAVDTTGAGDAYAAGFLYGYIHEMQMEKAGKIASLLAAKVVEQIGARLSKETISELRHQL